MTETPSLDLTSGSVPETTVALAGDWHGRVHWIGTAIPALHHAAPEVRTILHVGDLWPDEKTLVTIDHHAALAGIDRVLLTTGNHEPWGDITPALAAAEGAPARLSETVFVLPRPYRFEIGGRTFLSLGGATSIDRRDGVQGLDWWEDESIGDDMVNVAIAGGRTDIMLTHESPASTPVKAVRRILDLNPERMPRSDLAIAAASRQQVERVWNAVRPTILVHGHIHAPGAGTTVDGRRVVSLGCDGQPGNLELLDLATLELTTVAVPRRRRG